jgi:hypothetical protein
MDALARLGTTAVTLLAQAAGIAMMVAISWKFLMVIVSGGNERAFAQLFKTLLVFGLSIAVMTHLPETVELVQTVGGALFRTVVDAVRGAGAAV